jgi:hypothetical protein
MAEAGAKPGMACRRKDREICVTCKLAGIDGCAQEIGNLSVPLMNVPAVALMLLPLAAKEAFDIKADPAGFVFRPGRAPGTPHP